MEYEGLHDEFACADLPDDLQEANGVAFLLASNAFLKLADAYMRRDEATTLNLLNGIEAEIIETLRYYATEYQHGAIRADVVVEAAHKLGSLLGAGRALSKAAPGLH
jgi:hypothetical protein